MSRYLRIAHSRKTLVDARSVTLMRTLGALAQSSLAPMNTLRADLTVAISASEPETVCISPNLSVHESRLSV